jgi:methylated-DNA-[protein]-cysteine S-methyltransferase
MTRKELIVAPPLELAMHWRGDRLVRIDLAWAKGSVTTPGGSTFRLHLSETLARYLGGSPVDWPDLPLDFGLMPEFSKQVLSTLRDRVGWGELITYGRLAESCGNPRAARAVGAVMRANPWPLIVPCHRVIGSTGRLTGYGPGLAMKEYLLGLESSWPMKNGAA